jgi:hypothetical protein
LEARRKLGSALGTSSTSSSLRSPMGRRCGPNCSARSSPMPLAIPLSALSQLPALSQFPELTFRSTVDLCGLLSSRFIRGLAVASRWALQLVVLSVLSSLDGCTAAPVAGPVPMPPLLRLQMPLSMPITISALALAFFVIVALAVWANIAAVAPSSCGCCSSGGFPPPRRQRVAGEVVRAYRLSWRGQRATEGAGARAAASWPAAACAGVDGPSRARRSAEPRRGRRGPVLARLCHARD